MEIGKVTLVYFSPTGTTRKVLEGVARGIASGETGHVDLTLPEGTRRPLPPFSDELVIMGAPVYGGRLPVDAVSRFRRLEGNGTPAVLVVVYGNREFEDALLELRDLAAELGFIPVAGAAFIGEHSFATEDLPIANGRPDDADVRKALEFGAQVARKVAALRSAGSRGELEVPGRFPYEGGARAMAVSPVTREDLCAGCGTCAAVCPKAAIVVNGGVATEIALCIRCCACIKSCPSGARAAEDETLKVIAAWLNENCRQRKEPQTFGVEKGAT